MNKDRTYRYFKYASVFFTVLAIVQLPLTYMFLTIVAGIKHEGPKYLRDMADVVEQQQKQRDVIK